MVVVVDVKDVEFALTIAAIPVTILILIMAGYFTRKESFSGMIAIIVSSLGLNGRTRHVLIIFGSGPLLWRDGLLPLQTRPNVSAYRQGRALQARSQNSHFFCSDYNCSNCPDNHQCHRVRLEFPARTETLHREQKSGKRRGEAKYDGDA